MNCARGMLTMLCILCAAGCGPSEQDIHRMIRDELARTMERNIVKPVDVIGPYSPAVKIGNFLFLSGQIGLDQATGQVRNETIEIETHQVLDNLNTVLHAAGYDSSSVVSATVYLKNMNDYPKMNLVYGGFFQDGNYPARVTVEVSNLPKQANIEIALIAYRPS